MPALLSLQPVDVTSLLASSTQQHFVAMETTTPLASVRHNCSSSALNDSILSSSVTVNTTACSVDDLLPSYHEMFQDPNTTAGTAADTTGPLIPRTSSMSERRPSSHRRRFLAHRASQLAASLSRQ